MGKQGVVLSPFRPRYCAAQTKYLMARPAELESATSGLEVFTWKAGNGNWGSVRRANGIAAWCRSMKHARLDYWTIGERIFVVDATAGI
jgi:hypothetical protein